MAARLRSEPDSTPSSTETVAEQPAGPRGGLSLVDVRRLWPDILEQTKSRRRLAWMVLSQHAHVVDVDGTHLTVGFANTGARDSFVNGGCDEILRQSAIDVVGMDWRIESIVDPSGAAAQAPVVRQSATEPPARQHVPSGVQDAAPVAPTPDGPPGWVSDEQGAPAREALKQARAGVATDDVDPVRSADDDVDPDDADAETAALDTESLLSQTLGARLIEEIRHD